MEKDSAFLRKLSDLFLVNGAKSVTMDDVAREFSISKKTLYQKYKNKDALLEAVLEYKLEEIIARVKYLDEKIENAVARIICRDEKLDSVSDANNTLLMRQLIRYYPAIFNKHMLNFSERFSEILIHNIDKGREQGLYRQDFDPEMYAKSFFQLLMSYDNSPYFDSAKLGRTHYHREIMLMYLHAITTEKGKLTIKKLTENNEETH